MKLGSHLRIIILISSMACNGITCARERYFSLKDLIDQSDIVAIVDVAQSSAVGTDLLHVNLSVTKILKGVDDDTSSLVIIHPRKKDRVLYEHPPIQFYVGAKYLVFITRKTTNISSQPSFQLLYPTTSGAVRLEGDKIIKRPVLLDGNPEQFRMFNEYTLLQRIHELEVEGPCLPPARDRARELQEKGYSTDTLKQVVKAIESKDTVIRCTALGLYAQRAEENDAISQLKKGLADPNQEVRWHAAHWLGRLGSQAGLKQMQQDFEQLTTINTDLAFSEPNTDKAPELGQDQGSANDTLIKTMDVARILAELGDRQAYELASKVALEASLPEPRYGAASVLVEMAKTEQTTLETEGIKPVSVLCAMAISEKDMGVFYKLIQLVAKLLNFNNNASRILSIAKDNPNQSERMHRTSLLYFQEAKRH